MISTIDIFQQEKTVRKRLFILNHNLRERGTYFRAWKTAQAFQHRGWDVTFFTTGEGYYRVRTTVRDGIRVYETPSWFLAHGPDSGWVPLGMIWRTLFLLLKRADVIYTFSHKPVDALPAWLAKSIRKSCWITDWCDLWGGDGLNALMQQRRGKAKNLRDRWDDFVTKQDEKLESFAAKKADAVTVISQFLNEKATALRGADNDVFHFPSGADTERLRPYSVQKSRAQFDIPDEGIVLGYLTSWYPDEEFFLNAVRMAMEKDERLRLIIAGPPLECQDEVLREKPFLNRVHHVGRIPFKQVGVFLSAADILLMPLQDTEFNRSRWPNKIGDYLAVGKPMVACRVGEVIPFLDQYKVGMGTEITPATFADGILRLANDASLRKKMGTESLRVAYDDYDWENITAELIKQLHPYWMR